MAESFTPRRGRSLSGSRSANLLVSAGAVALSVIVIAVGGEIVLRAVAPRSDPAPLGVSLPGSARRYALKPNARTLQTGVEVVTNSLGFRDRDHSVAKPPGVRRITVLGDSYALGVGVAADEVFSQRMGVHLNAKVSRWEVLNFGVNGYDTEMELATLREVASVYAPDLVLVAYVLNDAEQRLPADAAPGQPSAPSLRQRLNAVHLLIKNRSMVYRYIVPKIGAMFARLGVGYWAGKTNEILHDYAPDAVGWARSRQALVEIDQYARSIGAETLVVIFPMMVDFRRYPLAGAHETIARFCREQGIPVLDLLPTLRRHAGEDLAVFLDGHPNSAAHRIFADAIAADLAQRFE